MKSLCTAALLFALACSQTQNGDTTTAQTDSAPTATSASASDTTATQPSATAPAAPAPAQEKPMSAYENKVAELHTTAGQINIRFFPDVAPNHVKNFISLAEQGFYNGTKFHRVIAGFMVQGGDPNTKTGDPSTWGTGGSPNNVRAEFNNVSHRRGIVSMARAQDPNSASSQFFIVVADSTFLDNQYTVFGQVTKGMDIADAIVASAAGRERPAQPVTITRVVIRDANADEKGPTPQ